MDDPFLFSQETDYANLLSVKLYEYSRADFDRCSVNTYAFNRIFAVFSSEGAGSTVGSPMFGGELPMEPGNLFFFSAGVPVAFHFRPGTCFYAFHYNLQLLPFSEIFLSFPHMERKMAPEIIQEFDRISRLPLDGIRRACKIKGMLFQITADFLPGNLMTFQNAVLSRYRKMLDYIERNIHAGITIDELADVAGMHRSTLSRSFSRDTGITLKKYISHQLQLQAALLLRESRLSIKEIARKLNFNDEYYFSHFFKRESGVSPREFRQQVFEATADQSSRRDS